MREASGPSFDIQAATEEYAEAIVRLVRGSGINPTGLDWRRFLIAVDGEGELIGCGQVKAHADGSRELASIAVRADWRRKGVATRLIEELLAANPGRLYLMCQSSLGPMYGAFGFREIDRDAMPKYFRRVSQLSGVLEALRKQGETLLIMWRDER